MNDMRDVLRAMDVLGERRAIATLKQLEDNEGLGALMAVGAMSRQEYVDYGAKLVTREDMSRYAAHKCSRANGGLTIARACVPPDERNLLPGQQVERRAIVYRRVGDKLVGEDVATHIVTAYTDKLGRVRRRVRRVARLDRKRASKWDNKVSGAALASKQARQARISAELMAERAEEGKLERWEE